MPYYAPETPLEWLYETLIKMRNPLGRSARRWQLGLLGPRAVADFKAHVARLGPKDTCIDLGANVGLVTAELAATGARVHAYEPDPLAFAELQKNVGHLPNVTLHAEAVGHVAGSFQLRRARNFDKAPLGKTTVSSIAFSDPRKYRDDDAITVTVRAFDTVLRGIGGPVALVKMDIEGAEFDILRAVFANPSAYNVDAIYCETHERQTYREFPEIDRMRRASQTIARPAINLYWP